MNPWDIVSNGEAKMVLLRRSFQNMWVTVALDGSASFVISDGELINNGWRVIGRLVQINEERNPNEPTRKT